MHACKHDAASGAEGIASGRGGRRGVCGVRSVVVVVVFGLFEGGFGADVIEEEVLGRGVAGEFGGDAAGDFGVFVEKGFFGGIPRGALVANVLADISA